MGILLFLMALGNFIAFHRAMLEKELNITYLILAIVFFVLLVS